MGEKNQIEISIPTDKDGYILLQCEHCGTFFKITPADLQDDRVFNIFCPSCGLISENYFTKDVQELALAKVKNMAMDTLYDEMKKIERKSQSGLVKFKVKSKPNHEPENLLHSGIDTMEITDFLCCQRTAKIMPLLKLTGCYCPFCGVRDYEVE